MNIKKITPLILIFILTFILTACSDRSQKDAEVKNTNQGTVTHTAASSQKSNSASTSLPSALPQESLSGKKEKLANMVDAEDAGLMMEEIPAKALLLTNAPAPQPQPEWNTESYNALQENGFTSTANDPLSTFSIDVDTASYSNVRRFINEGRLPPVGAVRIEEMINYFSYTYPQPSDEHPFSVTTELSPSPWNDSRKLVRIGLKAKDIDKKDLPPSNLVFLIDVSGSMSDANKLPLLQQAMKMLVKQLGERDRISLVVYAGNDHVVLAPTPCSKQQKIISAIDSLGAGGSTHASSGIATAYELAEQAFLPKGNNRIVLASDGDFNVGITSRDELQKLVEEKEEIRCLPDRARLWHGKLS